VTFGLGALSWRNQRRVIGRDRLHVDDGLITSNDTAMLDAFVAALAKRYEFKLDKNPDSFLGTSIRIINFTFVV
jgi:hypothetical protein